MRESDSFHFLGWSANAAVFLYHINTCSWLTLLVKVLFRTLGQNRMLDGETGSFSFFCYALCRTHRTAAEERVLTSPRFSWSSLPGNSSQTCHYVKVLLSAFCDQGHLQHVCFLSKKCILVLLALWPFFC